MPGENMSRIDCVQDAVADWKRLPQDLDRLLRLVFRGKFDIEAPVVVHRAIVRPIVRIGGSITRRRTAAKPRTSGRPRRTQSHKFGHCRAN
jgi:hypothetical protein